jgi:hypothetical protein
MSRPAYRYLVLVRYVHGTYTVRTHTGAYLFSTPYVGSYYLLDVTYLIFLVFLRSIVYVREFSTHSYSYYLVRTGAYLVLPVDVTYFMYLVFLASILDYSTYVVYR